MPTGYKVGIGVNAGKDLSEIFHAGTSSVVTNYKISNLTDISNQFQPIGSGIAVPRPDNKKTGYKIANGTDLCDLFTMNDDVYETNCLKINGNVLTFERVDYTFPKPYIKFLQPATVNVTLIGGGGGGNMGDGIVTQFNLFSGCSGGGGGGGGKIIASNLQVTQNEQFDITIGTGAGTNFLKGSGIDGGVSRFYSSITTDLTAFGGIGGGTSTSTSLTPLQKMCKGGAGGVSSFTTNVVNVTQYAGGDGGDGTYWGDPKYAGITDKTEYYKTNFGNGNYTVNGTSGGGGGGWNTAINNDPSTISYWVGRGGQGTSGGAALYSKIFTDTKGFGYGRGGGGLYNDASIDSGGLSTIKSGSDGVVIVEIISSP